MPLKKFWKRIFNSNEIEFQALKSRSAVELSSYNRKHKLCNNNNNNNRNHMPRFYSHYENLESSVHQQQLPQFQKNIIKDDDSFLLHCHKGEQPLMDHEKMYAVFCHMETKRIGDEYLAETLNDDNGHLGNQIHEPTFAAALDMCQKFREHPQFKEGLLLKSVESQTIYPYVHYAIFDHPSDDVQMNLCFGIYRLALKNAVNLKISQMHGVYEELSSMIRNKDKVDIIRQPTSRYTGYIIVAFKLLNYEHLETMEKNWLDWSGAKDLYKCSPKSWNLKRMTFHKLLAEPNQGNSFVFVLLCEFANLMNPENIIMGCDMVERLKQRYCGHVGLYRAQCTYTKSASSKNEWETFEPAEGRKITTHSVSADLTGLI